MIVVHLPADESPGRKGPVRLSPKLVVPCLLKVGSHARKVCICGPYLLDRVEDIHCYMFYVLCKPATLYRKRGYYMCEM